MNNAFDYCKTAHRVTKRELINALHQSLMQLKAAQAEEDVNSFSRFNHRPAIMVAERVLTKAGHIGLIK